MRRQKMLWFALGFIGAFVFCALLAFVGGSAFATSYTTTTSGNINAGATFVGGVAPDCTGASADTVIIANGHTLTMNVNCTLGVAASPTTASVAASSGTGTGILNIASGVTFTTLANVGQGNAAWTVGCDTTLWLRSDTALSWDAGGGTVPNAALNICTVGGARVTIKSTKADGVTPLQAKGFANSNTGAASAVLTAYNVDWINIGTAGADGYVYETFVARSGALHTVKNNTFTSCGQLFLRQLGATEGFDIQYNSFYDTVETNGRAFQVYNAPAVSGTPTRIFSNNYIRNGLVRYTTSGTAQGVTWDNNVIVSKTNIPPFDVGGALRPTFNTTNTLLLQQTGTGAANTDLPNGIHQAFFSLLDGHGAASSADWRNIATGAGANLTLDGAILEQWRGSGTGQPVGVALQNSGSVFTMKHTLLLPPMGGPGWKFAIADIHAVATGDSIIAEHNTWTTPASSGTLQRVNTDGVTTGAAAVYTSVQSNLSWSSSSLPVAMCGDTASSSIADGTFTTCDYNATYNISNNGRTCNAAGQYPLGCAKYSNTPGAHDIDGQSPAFVDNTRNFMTWCQSLDASLTDWATCISRMDAHSGSYSAAYSISAAYNWIPPGWAPTNAPFATAAHDGTTIGAVAYQASGTRKRVFTVWQ